MSRRCSLRLTRCTGSSGSTVAASCGEGHSHDAGSTRRDHMLQQSSQMVHKRSIARHVSPQSRTTLEGLNAMPPSAPASTPSAAAAPADELSALTTIMSATSASTAAAASAAPAAASPAQHQRRGESQRMMPRLQQQPLRQGTRRPLLPLGVSRQLRQPVHQHAGAPSHLQTGIAAATAPLSLALSAPPASIPAGVTLAAPAATPPAPTARRGPSDGARAAAATSARTEGA